VAPKQHAGTAVAVAAPTTECCFDFQLKRHLVDASRQERQKVGSGNVVTHGLSQRQRGLKGRRPIGISLSCVRSVIVQAR